MGLPLLNVFPHLRVCGVFVCPFCRQDCRPVIRTLWRRPSALTYNAAGEGTATSPDIFPTWFVFWTCHTCRFGHGHFLTPFTTPEIRGEL